MASSSNANDALMGSSSDSDYEPAEEEDQSEGENLAQAYLERLLAGNLGDDDEGEGEDGGDDGEGGTTQVLHTASQSWLPLSEDEMEFGDIEVEIEEEPGNIDETQAENAERSEQMPYVTILQILLLISQFAVARTRRRVLRLLQNSEIGRIFRFAPDDDEDEDDFNPRWARRRQKPDPNRFPKVPSDAGTELMNSGLFGANPAQAVNSRDKISLGKKKKLAWRIMERELAVGNSATERLNNRLLAQVRLAVLSCWL
jgi:WD repeat-containing protein 23